MRTFVPISSTVVRAQIEANLSFLKQVMFVDLLTCIHILMLMMVDFVLYSCWYYTTLHYTTLQIAGCLLRETNDTDGLLEQVRICYVIFIIISKYSLIIYKL